MTEFYHNSTNEIDVRTLQIDYDDTIGCGGMGTVYGVTDNEDIVCKRSKLPSDFNTTVMINDCSLENGTVLSIA